jgi:hypothetical protein
MDIDSANATLPFKKLTDEECAQYQAEGQCFRCHTQGHMACNCPKNSNSFNRTNSNVRETTNTIIATTSTAAAPPVPAIPIAPPVAPKLLFARQIRALKERMTEEEHSAYLDARDMGKDFCSAGL